ncbi:MAG: hypothetical protein R3290_12180 [Acidimicrobiia bacterium]|nr:hypothetical protein [Acidimicrobiia bacterium]
MTQTTERTDERTEHRSGSRTEIVRPSTWSPAQLLAAAAGAFLVIVGGVALARTGFADLTTTEVMVLGMGHTTLLGIIEVLLGITMLADAANPFFSRGTLISTGVIVAIFGAIAAIEPAAFNDWFGVNTGSGLGFVAAGLVAALAGFLSPVIRTDR